MRMWRRRNRRKGSQREFVLPIHPRYEIEEADTDAEAEAWLLVRQHMSLIHLLGAENRSSVQDLRRMTARPSLPF